MMCKHAHYVVDDELADRKQADRQQSSDDAEDNAKEYDRGPACHTILSTGGNWRNAATRSFHGYPYIVFRLGSSSSITRLVFCWLSRTSAADRQQHRSSAERVA